MSAPFTPGPWDISKGQYGALHVGPAVLAHPGKARIEYAADRGHDLLAQRDADAKLIHAAHALLAACKDALEVEDIEGFPDSELAGILRAAIAKAEGGAA